MAAEDSCPVDHKTRQAWLDKSREAGQASQQASPSSSSSSSLWSPFKSSPKTAPQHKSFLDQTRQTSSIPRVHSSDPTYSPSSESFPGSSTTTPSFPATSSSSHSTSSHIDAESKNWVYPSEQMFFNAMKRKNFSPREDDMRSIVPIHNAVNERAWKQILAWERPFLPAPSPASSNQTRLPCDGPKLVSFSGQASALTPRARWNMLLGYSAPFDRHDWIVDRCGTRVDYVIDFYAGAPGAAAGGDGSRGGGGGGGSSGAGAAVARDARPAPLNFYLDVRPKLNTWEGCKMRFWGLFGLAP